MTEQTEKQPIRVTMGELQALWFGSRDAVGLTDDHQREVRQVTMSDGTVYEAKLRSAES